jgi:hypothetical protein
MMAQLQMAPPRKDRISMPGARADSLNMVAVASDPPRRAEGAALCQPLPPVSFRLQASATDSHRVRYTRVAASTVCTSAAWLRRRSGKAGVHAMTAGAIGLAPGDLSDLPSCLAASPGRLEPDEYTDPDHKAVASAIAALRTADALIVGPLSPDDANAPGLLPHLADLASRAYRALRPPRELIAHPGFGQVARRFPFIQMSHREARALGAGAVDIGILAQRLRQVQGDHGEFAITAFGGCGLLWADGQWWEIEPVAGDMDESRAGAAFCTAWVVARRFLGAPASKALAYARSAAAAAVTSTCKNGKETLPCERPLF